MILKDNQALHILKESIQTPPFIIHAREKTKTLTALFTGHGFKEELSKIEHIEKSDDKWKARLKYSRSVVDLNERVFRLLDNVYSATGGSKVYNIESDSIKQQTIENITHIRGATSLEHWLQTNWMPVYHYDPAGVIFLEVPKETDKYSKVYPTYKSINAIRNYESLGQNLEWILFEPKKVKDSNNNTINLQRIVDQETDRTYKVDGSNFTLIPELTYTVPFGACPGIINSDITMVGVNDMRMSPAHNIIPIEQEYLRDQSILTIVKFLNGFKNLVRPKILCPSCHGVGKTGEKECSDCSATGFLINRDVTDEIILPIDLTNPDAEIPNANQLANWIGLDVETWDQYRKEIKILEILIHETTWGSYMVSYEGTNTETATGRILDSQPAINKLNKYSSVAERIEWQLSEWIANYVDPTKDKDISVVSVSYGKRFIIDPPDILLKIYKEAKKEMLTPVVLDRQLIEYITAKFKNDPEMLRSELLKMNLDLYVHLDIETVSSIYGAEQAQKKGLFNNWFDTLEMDDRSKSIDQLKTDRDTWILSEFERLEL